MEVDSLALVVESCGHFCAEFLVLALVGTLLLSQNGIQRLLIGSVAHVVTPSAVFWWTGHCPIQYLIGIISKIISITMMQLA